MDDDQLYPSAPTLYNFPDPPVAFRYPLSRKPGAGCCSALEGCFFLAKVSFFLSLEATQRKTVRTAIAALRADPSEVEVQAVGTATPRRNRRRPTEPVVADTQQCSVSVIVPGVAEARGLCRWALESGLPMATCIVRALVEIDQTTLGCLVNFLLQQSRGAARHSNRAVSTLTKARAVTRTRPPRRRAHRAFYWPDGREICHEKPSPRVPSGTRAHPSVTPVTKSVRSPEPTGP